ncbi:MAG TPA: cytochrome c-type biogenesis CcmF C-terminal domain-containing protein [Thermoanaerobaculia bacterium]|jgi:cytochrome c-type biogenesis protein CcmF|nr:cytochrome c-type biogenesis CcmF C-terminal domain-containing protein [Thermoanaerobaculia bacterium]
MDMLSQYYLPGAVALWTALFFSVMSIVGYIWVGAGDGSALRFARRSYDFFAVAITLSALILGLLLMMRDFRIEYVHQYSGMDLPGHYQLAAFWAGQKGSFLIWLLWGTLLGVLVRKSAGRNEPAIMGIYTLTLIGLLFILVRENPFVMLKETPLDGQGLNPLLQDDWMVIHPPIMFIGYAASAIPFAFAMASLFRRDYDDWAARAFPWALGGFLVLGCAILMGGYWAYKTLGWGGYWGWDPVENASLIPWLFGTVLIHGLHMERTKGRYRRANYVLAALVYLSVLYGTFLTRSGVLADFSVHSFVDLGISGWLIALMGTFVALAVWLLATRLRQVPTKPNEDPLLSRGTFMVLSTITVLVCAVVITFGTSAPLITRWFLENPAQVGPTWYNKVNLPIALLIALLLALVPYLTWRGDDPKAMLRKLIVPGLFALAVTAAAAAWQVRDPFHLLFVFLASLALATNIHKTVTRARAAGVAAAGGYLAHVGVGVILLGFLASSAYDESTKITLQMGTPKKLGDTTLTFTKFIPRVGREKEKMEILVTQPGRKPFFVYPKLFMNDRTRQVMANPDIRSTPFQDLYVSPIDFDPGQPQVQLAKGESGQIGGMDIRFVGFDLNAQGNAMAQMAAGGMVTIGTEIEVTRNGKPTTLKPIYRLNPANGAVDTPPMELPGGGAIFVSGINASDGAVQFQVTGISNPAKLSIDVTRKPLIQLVWYGLYIVLLGGAVATFNRLWQVRRREAVLAQVQE